MPQTLVQCPLCGKKAWQPGEGTVYHAECPKRGTGRTRKLAPAYVPVSEK